MGWARTDDLDGSPAELITFGLEGKAYAIDLGEANLAKLRKALQPFLTVAVEYGYLPEREEPDRRTNGVADIPVPASMTRRSGRRPPPRPPQSTKADTKTIRSWAQGEGISISDKGRIPADVVRLFEEAHR